MDHDRDAFERRLADDIATLADTPLPGRTPPEMVAEAATAAPRRAWWRVPLLAAAVVVAAIATGIVLYENSPTPVPAPVGRASASPAPSEASSLADPRYRCGGGHAFSPALLDEPDLDLPSIAPGEALAAFIESGRDNGLLPDAGWHLAGQDVSSASFVAEWNGVPSAEARLEHSDDEWRVVNWAGGCSPLLEMGGMNPATWTLVPRQEITPATTSFLADVTERSCTGGASSADRLEPPLISYGAERVVVAFVVEPLRGDASFCIANPATRVRVELDEPLGDRHLLDGGALPWADRIATAPDSEFWLGPLAVADWAGGDQALLTGRLRIGESCVTVATGGGKEVLLVWPTDRTAWNPDDRTVSFVNPDGRSVTIADGEQITFVGGGDSSAESGVPGEQWRDSTEWFRPPSDDCPLDAWWGVGEVRRQ